MISLEEKTRIKNLTSEETETKKRVLKDYITYVQQKLDNEEQRLKLKNQKIEARAAIKLYDSAVERAQKYLTQYPL